jgi:segregation and condensation protein A
MPYTIHLQQFQGPLDLLLQLIEEQKLDITQLSLAQVTDQYIEYLDQSPEIDPRELADFLVVAAKLLLIKSKELLPVLDWEQEEEASDLEKQLKIYKEYYEASKILHKIILKKNFTFVREKPPITIAPIFSPPKWLTKDVLAQTFQDVLKNLEPIVKLPQETIKRVISMKEKIRQIRELILEKAQINFGYLVKDSKSKVEIVVSFLALLELVKQKIVVVEQEGMFGEISIMKHETHNRQRYKILSTKP